MSAEPNGNMYDRTGWSRSIECEESDEVRSTADGVSSSLTDPHAERNHEAVIYTEWLRGGVPVLREYLWYDGRGCEHLIPDGASR